MKLTSPGSSLRRLAGGISPLVYEADACFGKVATNLQCGVEEPLRVLIELPDQR